MSRQKSQPGEESSLTSGGSITSETSSLGFRPVPKKRMFLSRQTSGVSEFSGRGSDISGGSVIAVPAPRRSTQRGSSVSSSQSNMDETTHLVSRPAQPAKTQTDPSQQPLNETHQALSVSSSEREQRPLPVARDRSVCHLQSESYQKTETQRLPTFRPESTRSDSSADRSCMQRCTEPCDEARRDAAPLYANRVLYSDRQDSDIIQGELSLPQSTTGKCGMPCSVPRIAVHSLCSLFRKCERTKMSFCDVTMGSDTSSTHS